jgi:hypothetical protein
MTRIVTSAMRLPGPRSARRLGIGAPSLRGRLAGRVVQGI